MSVFAIVAVVCTAATCNDYVIDTAETKVDNYINLVSKGVEFTKAWNSKENEKPLTGWLGKYKIGESVFEIVSIDIEQREIHEDDTP